MQPPGKEIMSSHSEFWITTYTGRKFRLMNPDPDMVDLRDISRGLSRACRFAGQIDQHYSVAEHSINVAYLVSKDPLNRMSDWKLALLHDAAEAYIGDLTTPFKWFLESFGVPMDEIEGGILEAVFTRFGVEIDQPSWEAVMQADRAMLAYEARRMVPNWRDWGLELPEPKVPSRFSLKFYSEQAARHEFEQAVLSFV